MLDTSQGKLRAPEPRQRAVFSGPSAALNPRTRPVDCAKKQIAELNFVSEYPADQVRGGWDGMNCALASGLRSHYQLHYTGPIRPGEDYATKLVSKAWRLLGLRGQFSAYSPRRLRAYARQVKAQALPTARADFFHGATPWAACRPARPYFAYIDACFHTYLQCYHNSGEWEPCDLERIYRWEANWLNGAKKIFVSSGWAAEAAGRAYELEGDNLQVVGLGGAIAAPARDTFVNGRRFLAVMTDFHRKGGLICVEAFNRVRSVFPEATLTIVGGPLPPEVLATPGLEYAGFLKKSTPEGLAGLVELFASAFALVLPSKAETTPIIIVEAGYFGCPVIAPRSFGIPEMVIDSETGLLISGEPNAANISDAMLQLCQAGSKYFSMRVATRQHCLDNLVWERVVQRMVSSINRG
jgi:glycosyltransferase involved in cell wall biosynthesis